MNRRANIFFSLRGERARIQHVLVTAYDFISALGDLSLHGHVANYVIRIAENDHVLKA